MSSGRDVDCYLNQSSAMDKLCPGTRLLFPVPVPPVKDRFWCSMPVSPTVGARGFARAIDGCWDRIGFHGEGEREWTDDGKTV